MFCQRLLGFKKVEYQVRKVGSDAAALVQTYHTASYEARMTRVMALLVKYCMHVAHDRHRGRWSAGEGATFAQVRGRMHRAQMGGAQVAAKSRRDVLRLVAADMHWGAAR